MIFFQLIIAFTLQWLFLPLAFSQSVEPQKTSEAYDPSLSMSLSGSYHRTSFEMKGDHLLPGPTQEGLYNGNPLTGTFDSKSAYSLRSAIHYFPFSPQAIAAPLFSLNVGFETYLAQLKNANSATAEAHLWWIPFEAGFQKKFSDWVMGSIFVGYKYPVDGKMVYKYSARTAGDYKEEVVLTDQLKSGYEISFTEQLQLVTIESLSVGIGLETYFGSLTFSGVGEPAHVSGMAGHFLFKFTL